MSRNLATELEPLTLAAYVATWPERATEKLSAYLRRRCRWMLRAHILPALGTRPLADLTRDDVRAHLVSLLAGGLAPLTVRHMFRVLRAVLDSALVEGLVAENVGFGASRGLGLERRKDAPPPRPRRDDEADAELPPGTGMVPETFAAFARFWLADRMRAGSLKRSSVGGYRAVLAIVLRDLQALTAEFDPPLSAITRTVVRQMLTAQLDRGYASSSVRLHLAVLRGVLNAARLDYELLPGTNPCERLGHFLPRRPGPRTQTAIDRAHVAGFVAAARTLNLTIATLILVGFRTGMRLGELLGLRWDDVDLPRERVTVRHTLDRRGTLGSPKGGRVVDLPLAPGVCAALAALPRVSPWVFVSPTIGRPWSRTHVRRVMAVACERAGIPYASPHALRHSFCTHLADDGVNPWTLRDLARHASITTTEKYLHLNQRHRSLVARLEETP